MSEQRIITVSRQREQQPKRREKKKESFQMGLGEQRSPGREHAEIHVAPAPMPYSQDGTH